MGKIIFWIVIAFVVLFGLRLVNVAAARRRRKDPGRAAGPPELPMVRCHRCGVFLPRADTVETAGGPACNDPNCRQRR